MLRLTGGYEGLLFEYVHIKPGSCRVKEGDTVSQGQHLCDSGDVGFCPSPHLHIQAHAPGSDPVEVGRVQMRMPRAGHVVEAHLVVHDEQDVHGRRGLRTDCSCSG